MSCDGAGISFNNLELRWRVRMLLSVSQSRRVIKLLTSFRLWLDRWAEAISRFQWSADPVNGDAGQRCT